MPDLGAERRQEEAQASQQGAAKSGYLTFLGPSFREECEQKGHGEVHDAIEGRANDTGDFTTSVQRPIARIVFLKDPIAHGEACAYMSDIAAKMQILAYPILGAVVLRSLQAPKSFFSLILTVLTQLAQHLKHPFPCLEPLVPEDSVVSRGDEKVPYLGSWFPRWI